MDETFREQSAHCQILSPINVKIIIIFINETFIFNLVLGKRILQ